MMEVSPNSPVRYTKGGSWIASIPGLVCTHCFTIFTGQRATQKFCTNVCKHAAKSAHERRLWVEKKCASCAATFHAHPGNLKDTCSKTCAKAWVAEKNRRRRERTCVQCGEAFLLAKAGKDRKVCSKACLRSLVSAARTGLKQSAETIALRKASIEARYAIPENAAKRRATNQATMAKLWADPEFAAASSVASSERMIRRHTDPEFLARKSVRSSCVMKQNWKLHRENYVRLGVERYARDLDAGLGLNSETAKRRKLEACTWIMTEAQAALHCETQYNELFRLAMERNRNEHPFNGQIPSDDYYDYCRMIGTMTVNAPECRDMADSFMSKAIPRFAAIWQANKVAA